MFQCYKRDLVGRLGFSKMLEHWVTSKTTMEITKILNKIWRKIIKKILIMCLLLLTRCLPAMSFLLHFDGLHNVTVLQHSKMMIDRVKV
jgi:hypothetical protein